MDSLKTKKEINEIVNKLVECGRGLEIAKYMKDEDPKKSLGIKLLNDTIIEETHNLYRLAIPGGEA